MTSWTTILRDLALTAFRAVSRATTSGRSGGSAGIDIPDLATVDEARRGQRERAAQAHDRTPDHPAAESDEPVAAPAPATTPDAPARRSRAEAAPADDAPPRPFRPRDDDGDARDDTDAHVAAQGDAGGGISPSDQDRDRRRMDRDDDGVASAGQVGPAATVEVDPRDLDLVATSYNPDTDGDPDPGEIVWTWVPYEEADGRGKDRPVVVVARLPDAAVLAVQLSSRDHDGNRGWVGIGAGDWDGEHRPSWVNLDRILRIHPDGMRREAAILDRDRFARLSAALASHHHWPS